MRIGAASSVVVGAKRPSAVHAALREGLQETEVTAHIALPKDGGWGWVVVACSFTSIGLLDSVAFTFGSFIADLSRDLDTATPLIALVNSITVAMFYLCAPLGSALINRFGFRACGMAGALIGLISLLVTYFTRSIYAMYFTWGLCAGFGFSLNNIASVLVVGFYFERYRAIALAITQAGSGVGIFVISPVTTYLVEVFGWRTAVMCQCGLMVAEFCLAIAYRPLRSVAVTTKGAPVRTVTFLPVVSQYTLEPIEDQPTTTAMERFLQTASNIQYPTGATIMEDSVAATIAEASDAGPSAPAVRSLEASDSGFLIEPQDSKSSSVLTTKPEVIKSADESKTKQWGSTTGESKTMQKNSFQIPREQIRLNSPVSSTEPGISQETGSSVKRSWWSRHCCWKRHVSHTRPMYRDDAFYSGPMSKVPEYDNILTVGDKRKATVEYQLAVTRAISTVDLQEKRGLCSTAVRRVLVTMLDPSLLRRHSFIFICLSAFGGFAGLLVPLVFLQERNRVMGLPEEHAGLFISVVGISSCMGRLVLGAMANYNIDPIKLSWVGQLIAGAVTCLSHLSYTVEYQYLYCFTFGFFMGGSVSLKAIVMVSLYGLGKLTNAMGVILLFQGFGSLISSPLGGLIILNFGYTAGFVTTGIFISIGALFMIPTKSMVLKENIKL